jgi:ATP-dependent Lon protease
MFIATANSLDTISIPLRDRMEIIDLSGYTLEEKVGIAQKHLVPKALLDTGLDHKTTKFNKDLLVDIITNYTRESGVRQCERLIRKLCSKTARSIVENKKILVLSSKNLDIYLGPRKYLEEKASFEDQVGIANGLAWTSYGGEMLKIEAILMPGKGKLMLTGQLGDVMKESAQAALSYARAHAKEFGIDNKLFTCNDLHIHVPAGATPKDGPSAGITMLTSILSALTSRPINARYAMTGELNLRGEIMPIGGVREKILAAKRNKISSVIFPFSNQADLVGIEEVAQDINVVWVKHANEVLQHVLLHKQTAKGERRR